MKKPMIKLTVAAILSTGIINLMNEETVSAISPETVTRLQGADRFETAALISQEGFDKADTVIIANAREFADALAGVPLAYKKNAPILLAQGSALRADIVNEINRLEAKQAIILGGQAAVSSSIEAELSDLGLSVERLAGANRFETAEIIAENVTANQPSSSAVVVDGFEFADAMSVAPFAAREGMPIYLTRSNRLVSEEALKDYENTYIIGGTAAISTSVESQLNKPHRIQGANRYSTNIAVMNYFGVNSDHLFISTGQNFVDALTGSVLAAHSSTAIALVRNDVSNELNDFIEKQDFARFTLLGGSVAVPERVAHSLEGYLTEKPFAKEETVVENEVAFKTVEKENDQLPVGEREIVQEGYLGYDEVTYLVTFQNGQEIDRKELSRETHEPIAEIVEVGTQIVTYQVIEEIENIQDFEVVLKEDDQLPNGESRIDVEGQNGYDEVLYEVSFAGETEIERKEIERNTIAPINEIKVIGTQVKEVLIEYRSENFVDYEVVEEENEYILTGHREIVTAGEYGYDNIVYEVTYLNGVESDREEIERKVVEPTAERVLVGTRDNIVKQYSLRFGSNNQGSYRGIFERTFINGVEVQDRLVEPLYHSYSSQRVSSFTQRVVLPYRIIEIEDETLEEGKKEVVTAGRDGIEEVKHTYIYLDNRLAFSGEESRNIVERPVNEVIAIGTRVTD